MSIASIQPPLRAKLTMPPTFNNIIHKKFNTIGIVHIAVEEVLPKKLSRRERRKLREAKKSSDLLKGALKTSRLNRRNLKKVMKKNEEKKGLTRSGRRKQKVRERKQRTTQVILDARIAEAGAKSASDLCRFFFRPSPTSLHSQLPTFGAPKLPTFGTPPLLPISDHPLPKLLILVLPSKRHNYRPPSLFPPESSLPEFPTVAVGRWRMGMGAGRN
ncbi:hypothetical protein RUND412_006543 [Rhizina undulata]